MHDACRVDAHEELLYIRYENASVAKDIPAVLFQQTDVRSIPVRVGYHKVPPYNIFKNSTGKLYIMMSGNKNP